MIKVLDLFAGAGGFGLGFRLAGYDVFCSVEIDQWAAHTLIENKPASSTVINDDITKFKTKETILKACNGQLPEVIIGGPPCQGFSHAGPAHKRDPKDPRNTLFIDFARWVNFLRPKIFVMENVKGILSRKNADGVKVIDIIRSTFHEIGYELTVWKLNAANYGVPQIRERVFIVGNCINLNLEPPPITHKLPKQNSQGEQPIKKAIKSWDALSDLPKLKASAGKEEASYTLVPKTDYQLWARQNSNLVYNHVAMNHTQRVVERFRTIQWRQTGLDVTDKHKAKKRSGNGALSEAEYRSNHRRIHPKQPSFTIPAQFYSSFIHPFQHRNITAREAARLQSFPDWYRFMGKRTVISSSLLKKTGRHSENHLSQYNQIGNAVPPLLAKVIAEQLIKYLD